MTEASLRYSINPRFAPDGIAVRFGGSGDAALVYDAVNDEFTIQTANAAGALADRIRVAANTDTPSVDMTGMRVNNLLAGLDDGSAASPALRFDGDPDTGLYRIGADILGIAVGGAELARFAAGGMQLGDNKKALFGAGGDAELYYDGSNIILDPDAVGSGGLSVDGRIGINTAPGAGTIAAIGGALSHSLPHAFQVQTAALTVNGGGTNARLVAIGGLGGSIATENNSITYGRISAVELFEPNIIKGASDTVTAAATLYVGNAPSEGVDNYALLVDAGLNRFDGDGQHVFELPVDATDPTGGGGAASGRIPVKIGGATRYLAYY